MHNNNNNKEYVVGTLFKKRLIFFGQNSGIHGLNQLFHENGRFISRLFWIIVLLASTGCLYLMLVPVAQLGVEVNYTPDTRYIGWTTTFPAVTVCEVTDTKLVQRKLTELYQRGFPVTIAELVEHLSYDHRRYLSDLLFARGHCKNAQCLPCDDLVPCDVPWRDIIENIHKKCTELLFECSYNGARFPCCDFFREVDSERGICYSFNTLQHMNIQQSLFGVNRSTGPGVLTSRLLSVAEISIHSTEELSTNNLNAKFKYLIDPRSMNRFNVLFSLVEIENDPGLENEDISVRKCRYLHELPDELFHTYPVYSLGACKLAHNTKISFSRCGCINPVRDLSYKKMFCNYTGLNCLATYEVQNKLNSDKGDNPDNCLPSCVESEITAVHHSAQWVGENPGNLVEIRMASLPTLRYQRHLLRTKLDIVVSIGGLVGLFFSASILSLVEIFYLILRSQNVQ